MLQYSSSQLLIRMKITTIIYFYYFFCIKINPTHDIFKRMFIHYKCYISIKLTFLKQLMLIQQVHQKSAIFATIGIS